MKLMQIVEVNNILRQVRNARGGDGAARGAAGHGGQQSGAKASWVWCGAAGQQAAVAGMEGVAQCNARRAAGFPLQVPA